MRVSGEISFFKRQSQDGTVCTMREIADLHGPEAGALHMRELQLDGAILSAFENILTYSAFFVLVILFASNDAFCSSKSSSISLVKFL